MRRTDPFEPVEPTEPAEPLLHVIKGRYAPRANPNPQSPVTQMKLTASYGALSCLSCWSVPVNSNRIGDFFIGRNKAGQGRQGPRIGEDMARQLHCHSVMGRHLFTQPSGHFLMGKTCDIQESLSNICCELATGIPHSAPDLAVMSIHLSFTRPITIPKLIYFSY